MKGETEERDILGSSTETVQIKTEPKCNALFWLRCQVSSAGEMLDHFKEYNLVQLCHYRSPFKLGPSEIKSTSLMDLHHSSFCHLDFDSTVPCGL